MHWYTYILLAIYIICCFFLIGVVLLQSGKGDMASAFGGGSSQTAFGPRSASNTLSKVTMGVAATFMVLAFVFTIPGIVGSGSVAEGIVDKPAATKTATPAPAPATTPAANSTSAPVATPGTSPVATPAATPAANATPAASSSGKPADTAKPAEKPAENGAKPAEAGKTGEKKPE